MIKRGNLAKSLQSWLMGTLQLGPGIGDVFYLVVDSSAYHTYLVDQGIQGDHIFTSLVTAEDAMTGSRNDVLCVFPGAYTLTAALTWDKSQTHIVGVGGPNQRQQPSTLTTGGVRISTTTASVAQLFNITGNYCQFHNIGTMNNGANTANLYDILVNARNFYAENCSFRGGNNTTQNQNAAAGIPIGIQNGYAHTFKNCQVGQAGNTARTTGPGYVKFITTDSAACGGCKFIDCTFEMQSATNGANASGFLVQQNSIDRLTQFIGCTFYNFSENWGAIPDYLFNIDQTSTFDIILRNCSMAGFDIVSDSARVLSSDAAPNSAAVEAVAVATS